MKQRNVGLQLATDMVLLDEKIEYIQQHGTSSFEIVKHPLLGWYVVTSYCTHKGCVADCTFAPSQEEAAYLAAKLTYFKQKPTKVHMCPACEEDYAEQKVEEK